MKRLAILSLAVTLATSFAGAGLAQPLEVAAPFARPAQPTWRGCVPTRGRSEPAPVHDGAQGSAFRRLQGRHLGLLARRRAAPPPAAPQTLTLRMNVARSADHGQAQRNPARDRRGEVIFVGSCAAIFLVLAACAVYAVVTFAV